jgi:N-succinyldiaminopimelate aminotransferase
MAGATLRPVVLHPPRDGRGSFWFDEHDLRAAFSRRTRIVLLNTPHNPTGKVFTRDELELIAALAIEHDAIVVTDEVYEHLTYDPALPHLHLATFPGMRERTLTLSSLGKTFSLTGWKIGWAIAPPPLSAAVRAAHQFMTFCTATPLQHGGAAAISSPGSYAAELRTLYAANRDALAAALRETGWLVHPSHATYFLMADHSALGFADDREACAWLTTEVGVAAIPPSVFYTRKELGRSLVRFAFCKKRDTIDEACRRLRARPRIR